MIRSRTETAPRRGRQSGSSQPLQLWPVKRRFCSAHPAFPPNNRRRNRMQFPAINYLAVLVAAIVIFVVGGLWYSPLLFAKRWIALQNRTEEQMRAQAAASNMPLMYLSAFICAFIQAWVLAMVIGHMSQVAEMGIAHAAIFSALS